MSPENPTHLCDLHPGQLARVVQVCGDDALAQRLLDFGFWPDTKIQVIRRAPLGDPTEYRLRGFRIALRYQEASRVIVRSFSGGNG